MDDYYDLLGVDPGADSADIKSAYRDKKAALDAKGDKAETARVNKAWNVLSDPYQRGRYDAQRESAAESGELVAAGPAATTDAPPPRRRGLFQPPQPAGERPPPPPPTIELPEGLEFAAQRKRIGAMLIDLAVIILVLIAVVAFQPRVLENRHPDEFNLLDDMSDVRSDLDDAQNTFDDATDDLQDLEDSGDATEAELTDAREAVDDARADLDDVEEEAQPFLARCEELGLDTEVSRDDDDDDPVTVQDQIEECALDAQSAMQSTFLLTYEIIFVFGFLYLVIPSAITGQTLGKRIRGIRVIRQDGSKLGWKGALTRYGLVVGASNLLFLIPVVQVLAFPIVLFLVLGWMRNPNRQGMHDRYSKTVVVEAQS